MILRYVVVLLVLAGLMQVGVGVTVAAVVGVGARKGVQKVEESRYKTSVRKLLQDFGGDEDWGRVQGGEGEGEGSGLPPDQGIVLSKSCYRHRHAVLHELYHAVAALRSAAEVESSRWEGDFYVLTFLGPAASGGLVLEEGEKGKEEGRSESDGQGSSRGRRRVFAQALEQDIHITCHFSAVACDSATDHKKETAFAFVTKRGKTKINLCQSFFAGEEQLEEGEEEEIYGENHDTIVLGRGRQGVAGTVATLDDYDQCETPVGKAMGLEWFDTRARTLLRNLLSTAPTLQIQVFATSITECRNLAWGDHVTSSQEGLPAEAALYNADTWAWIATGIYWRTKCGREIPILVHNDPTCEAVLRTLVGTWDSEGGLGVIGQRTLRRLCAVPTKWPTGWRVPVG